MGNYKMNELLDMYDEQKFVLLNFNFKYDEKTKKLDKPPKHEKWNELTCETYKEKFNSKQPFGTMTGRNTDIIVVDIDNKNTDKTLHGLDTWKQWISQHGDINTPIQESVTGGLHYFFKYDKRFEGDKKYSRLITSTRDAFIYNEQKVSIDIRSNGGYVALAPTAYEKQKYKWIKSPEEVGAFADIPKWLIDYLVCEEKAGKDYGDDKIDIALLGGNENKMARLFLNKYKDDIVLSDDDKDVEKTYVHIWDENLKYGNNRNIV